VTGHNFEMSFTFGSFRWNPPFISLLRTLALEDWPAVRCSWDASFASVYRGWSGSYWSLVFRKYLTGSSGFAGELERRCDTLLSFANVIPHFDSNGDGSGLIIRPLVWAGDEQGGLYTQAYLRNSEHILSSYIPTGARGFSSGSFTVYFIYSPEINLPN
jgi:hypothetical protein